MVRDDVLHRQTEPKTVFLTPFHRVASSKPGHLTMHGQVKQNPSHGSNSCGLIETQKAQEAVAVAPGRKTESQVPKLTRGQSTGHWQAWRCPY